MIILERDGTLHHVPPEGPLRGLRRGQIRLSDAQAQPTLIERVISFAFDVLGLHSLELRIDEQPKR